MCLDGYWKHTQLSRFRKRIWKLRIWDRQFRQKAIKLICIVLWPGRRNLSRDSSVSGLAHSQCLDSHLRISFKLFCTCSWLFLTFNFLKITLSNMYTCVHMPPYGWQGHRQGQLLLSTVCISGIELRLSGLAADPLAPWVLSPVFEHFVKVLNSYFSYIYFYGDAWSFLAGHNVNDGKLPHD